MKRPGGARLDQVKLEDRLPVLMSSSNQESGLLFLFLLLACGQCAALAVGLAWERIVHMPTGPWRDGDGWTHRATRVGWRFFGFGQCETAGAADNFSPRPLRSPLTLGPGAAPT